MSFFYFKCIYFLFIVTVPQIKCKIIIENKNFILFIIILYILLIIMINNNSINSLNYYKLIFNLMNKIYKRSFKIYLFRFFSVNNYN